MLNCCQSPAVPQKQTIQQYQNQRPKYKYSFRERAHILVNNNSIHPNPRLINENNGIRIKCQQEQQLQKQYQMICKQKQQLEYFMKNNVRLLEGQVDFYQHQVKIRQKEIQQLAKLLTVVLERKRVNQWERSQRLVPQTYSTRTIRFS